MIDAAEHSLLAKTIRDLVTAGDTVDEALRDFGWLEMLASDEALAVSVLFEALGETGARSTALSWLVSQPLWAALGETEGDGPVLMPFGTTGPAGVVDTAGAHLQGITWATLSPDDLVVVPVTSGGEIAIGGVPGMTAASLAGIDASLGLQRVSGTVAWGPPDLAISGKPARQAWERSQAAAFRAIAHQLLGAMRAMLDVALDHARQRMQFGVPIGSYQAVQHRLAEARVAVQVTEDTLAAAWVRHDHFAALCAKAVAGRAATQVIRHCQQVLAGIGFTAEHDFPRYAKRMLALDQLFGPAHAWVAHIGAEVRTGAVPALVGIDD